MTYRDSIPDGLEPWDLADPALMLRDLSAREPLLIGRTLLVRIHEPATRQRILTHTVLWTGHPPEDHRGRVKGVECGLRRLHLRDFELDYPERLESIVAFVVVRSGRAGMRRDDYAPRMGFRYANNAFQALGGDTIVVTEHGWILDSGGLCGISPRAVWESSTAAVVVNATFPSGARVRSSQGLRRTAPRSRSRRPAVTDRPGGE